MSPAPSILVFDVNETLLDFNVLRPVFARIFGDAAAMREWFGKLVMHSMAITASENYVDFFTLGQGVLRMLAATRGIDVSDDDGQALKQAMVSMPVHPDVADGLSALQDSGFRLVTLTNSPPDPDGPSPLERAKLDHLFERQFSVDACRVFKPAPSPYLHVCEQLGVAPADCMMVAAHVWDTMGAQSVGFSAALIARPGNATLPVAGLPQPTVVASDLRELGAKLTPGAPPASTR